MGKQTLLDIVRMAPVIDMTFPKDGKRREIPKTIPVIRVRNTTLYRCGMELTGPTVTSPMLDS